ncbi:MAG: NAD-dependent epimerase/dehydratase family protein [Candidatus Eremiobacteraeota bacterium]|nr:NAD-dependent epimerase/dehydratase family protein [Candidatus Eremiobacteraeota bacterium]
MGLPKRILITGGAGLIGSHIADQLLAAGHEITILDNYSTGRPANIRHLEGHVRVVTGDILDEAAVDAAVAGSEYVFHMAAAVGVANVVGNPLGVIVTNVHGTENVLAACAKHDSGVIIGSTSEIYGKSPRVPFSEDDDRVLGSTRINRWAYSTSKALDEHLAIGYARHGLRATIVRYFNTYGPRMHERGDGQVVARFAALALRGQPLTVHDDGKQTRCFTFVEDSARCSILAAASDAAVGQVFNVGSQHELSINELATIVRDRLGSTSEIAHLSYEEAYGPDFEDTRRRVPDVRKAKDVLGFEATFDLDAGLERTLPWCREHYGVGKF